jgi:aryl-alcohol dehydrogenase-like predicted oxidoreductase
MIDSNTTMERHHADTHPPVHQMQNYAITNRLTPFISMQNHYNVLYREEEREMFPTLKVSACLL